MSAADVRQALADAANTVSGINCTPYYRQSTKPGDAMVRYDHTSYPTKLRGVVTWQVVIILGQDMAQAEQFADQHISDVVQALTPQMTISRVTQAQMQTPDSGLLPSVIIEGVREA